MKTLSKYYKHEGQDLDYKSLAKVIYALQAFAFLLGGIPFVFAVFLNYANRHHVKGTWLESHYAWQINTFWVALILVVVGVLTLPTIIGVMVLAGATIWVIHRIAYGWITLNKSSAVKNPSKFF